MSPSSPVCHPSILCIVGRKDSGKTELTVALAGELNRRGHRVMTAKHGHGFRLDHPGKDSWRHRHEGGALRTVLAGPRDFAVVGEWPRDVGPSGQWDLEELVRRFLPDADIVLAEGFKTSRVPRVEVFRSRLHERPLYDPGSPEARYYLALVADREMKGLSIPVYSLGDPDHVQALAGQVEELVRKPGRGGTPPGQP
jgi:molybdopterin-guanine dinucleotide biosynthesis protein B